MFSLNRDYYSFNTPLQRVRLLLYENHIFFENSLERYFRCRTINVVGRSLFTMVLLLWPWLNCCKNKVSTNTLGGPQYSPMAPLELNRLQWVHSDGSQSVIDHRLRCCDPFCCNRLVNNKLVDVIACPDRPPIGPAWVVGLWLVGDKGCSLDVAITFRSNDTVRRPQPRATATRC